MGVKTLASIMGKEEGKATNSVALMFHEVVFSHVLSCLCLRAVIACLPHSASPSLSFVL